MVVYVTPIWGFGRSPAYLYARVSVVVPRSLSSCWKHEDFCLQSRTLTFITTATVGNVPLVSEGTDGISRATYLIMLGNFKLGKKSKVKHNLVPKTCL